MNKSLILRVLTNLASWFRPSLRKLGGKEKIMQCVSLKFRNIKRVQYCSIAQQGNYDWQQLIGYLKTARGEDLECSQHKEMVYFWGDKFENYPDLIVACYIHVLKCHTVPCKNVQLLVIPGEELEINYLGGDYISKSLFPSCPVLLRDQMQEKSITLKRTI